MTDEKTHEEQILEATQQELDAWKLNPDTQRFFAFLKARRFLDIEALARGAYSGKNMEQAALFQAKVVGRVEVLEELLEFNADKLLTLERDIADAKYIRL